ncbi:MAG TPA: deoxyribodipyrimidine photo-lyase [Polyangiaceae bacterium]|jgi:deoxyribodipyrimidine photo-lyase|nr:deoxyribodipyrimidine photo-lyase [Polyangiaceae bacterium]
MRTLVWFRGKDLRIADNLALAEACKGTHVIPLFVAGHELREGAHRAQFVLESAAALAKNLEQLGSGLVVVRGDAVAVVPEKAARWKVDRVVALRRTEPRARDEAKKVRAALRVPLTLLDGETLLPPETIRTQGGTPFSVFTPFARAFRQQLDGIGATVPAPKHVPPLPPEAKREGTTLPTLAELGITRADGVFTGGERAARERMKAYLANGAADYPDTRDRVDLDGTSRFSADLRAGVLSIRTIWNATEKALARKHRALDVFTNELLWREFAHSLIWDRPRLVKEPFREAFASFPWEKDRKRLEAWKNGKTGYPVVDASARQLLAEGFVPNRARMISASFLTKHLFIDYHSGEKHYYEELTDGDQSQNNTGWQWSAGCGVDAQPYFRVFNPTVQGKRFDPDGVYVRRWLPELANLPTRYIHEPSEAPARVLAAAGVVLDQDYPSPIVDHAEARGKFLAVASSFISKG